MATKTLPLEELKGTTVSDLFAYSGSKLVELNDWINEQLDEVVKFPFDTFHKQGYVVNSMVEVFSKTEKKEKTKALCGLAGRLWFAHRLLHEQNINLRKESAGLTDKLTEVEEELLVLLTEKNELAEKVLQLQHELENDTPVPSGSGEGEYEGDRNANAHQLRRELERVREELSICTDQLDNLRKVNRGHVNTLYELQTQARENQRRSDNYKQRIQDLEDAQKRETPQNPSDCDGSCKDQIRQLETQLRKANEEIESLKENIHEERDRYWDAKNAVHDREISIEHRESKISRLEKENDMLVRRVSESQEEVQGLRTRLMKEGNRRDISPRPLTPEVIKTRTESDPAEPSENAGSYQRGKTYKESRKEAHGDGQRKRTFIRYNPSSDDGSDPEWTEIPRRKNKNKKNERRHRDRTGEEVMPHASAKSIKTLRGMLPSFSKSDKTGSILEHLSLYQRLMETLEMDSDVELRTYLSWTFAADSQSFFLSVNSNDYDTWAEYRCEVIKHFSPHRNAHEALRHALNLKCESNQHPRDYLQLLKNAFAQVQKEVNVETKQFKDAYFYGLPKHIRTQLARDYNEDRSIDWIYKQAKSIYDVSRTEENTEVKDRPKPSKVCELSKEKELPFETGGSKPRPVQKEKEWKKGPERKMPEGPAREPEVPDTISPRYKGNNPIPNFVYRAKENHSDTRAGGAREKPRESERSERAPYHPQGRDGNAPDTYRQGGYDRPEYRSNRRDNRDYREWQETRPYSDNRDRYQQWDERPRSPRQPNRLNALEEQLNDLTQHCKKMLTKDSGPSPRVHAVSASEPTDRDTPRPGQ